MEIGDSLREIKNVVVSAQNGNDDAFRQLVRSFRRMALSYAYSLLGNIFVAEEVTQEAFLRVYLKLSDLRHPDAFPAWLKRIVFSECQRIERKRKLQTVSLSRANNVASDASDPPTALMAKEQLGEIRKCLNSLTDAQRVAVTLFYMGDYAQKEISAFLDVPVTAVKKRLHDARKKLKQRMINMVEKAFKSLSEVVNFEDRAMQRILREMNFRDLALMLVGASDQLKEKVYRNVSGRLAERLKDDVEILSGVNESSTKEAADNFLETVNRLHDAGEITGKALSKKAKEKDIIQSVDFLKKKSPSESSVDELVELFYQLALKGRKHGLLSFESDVEKIDDDILLTGLQLIVDGTAPEIVSQILQRKLKTHIRKIETKYEMIGEGVLSIQAGDHPRLVREKMKVFID